MRFEGVQFGAEEIIMTGAMTVWAFSCGERQIDLSKIKFDAVKFLKIIKKCKNAGLIYNLIHGGRQGIINAPKELDAAISHMCGEYAARSREACASVAKVMLLAKEKAVKCIAGGGFAVMQEIAAAGQLFIDELVFYTDREIDLGGASDKIPCRCIVKDKAFFDKYSNDSGLMSESVVNAMREEMLSGAELKELDGDAILSYMLYAEYNDRLNYEPELPPCRNAGIERLFGSPVYEKTF